MSSYLVLCFISTVQNKSVKFAMRFVVEEKWRDTNLKSIQASYAKKNKQSLHSFKFMDVSQRYLNISSLDVFLQMVLKSEVSFSPDLMSCLDERLCVSA